MKLIYVPVEAPSLTVNPSGASWYVRHKHPGLGRRCPALVARGLALVGGVPMNEGLTVSDMAVGVGRTVAVGIWQQDIIVHRESTQGKKLVFLFKEE